MPEQDNWKEKYKSFVEDAREYGAFPQPLVEHVEGFISSLISSQARALKERMKAETKEKLDKLVVMSFIRYNTQVNVVDIDDVRASLLGKKPEALR